MPEWNAKILWVRRLCVLTLLLVQSSAMALANDRQFTDIFDAEGTAGTLVVVSLGQQKVWVHDEVRAAERKTPASTFKIANSLFALEAGAVADVDETVPWNGKKWRIKAWNKPHSLRSGIIVSSVPTYKELARRIGLNQMKSFVAEADYGNQTIGKAVDNFWLDGSLAISAYEQIDFLKRLHARDLPFATENLEATIDILEVDRGENWVLRAKTGWAIDTNPDIGWYVGWLELQDDTFLFAVNIDMLDSKKHLHSRTVITRHALRRITGEELW